MSRILNTIIITFALYLLVTQPFCLLFTFVVPIVVYVTLTIMYITSKKSWKMMLLMAIFEVIMFRPPKPFSNIQITKFIKQIQASILFTFVVLSNSKNTNLVAF